MRAGSIERALASEIFIFTIILMLKILEYIECGTKESAVIELWAIQSNELSDIYTLSYQISSAKRDKAKVLQKMMPTGY